jgi:hypothetical protein
VEVTVRIGKAFATAAGLALLLHPGGLAAQAYRVRLDTRFQSVEYRGWQLDSVAASTVVTGPDGGLETPSGFAVTCVPGRLVCTFYRPQPRQDALPLVSTADVSVWNLGLPGLRLYGRARVGTDLANPDTWPGTRPALQLVEGFAEYAASAWSVQAGRLYQASRFGYTGFDGGRAQARVLGGALSASAYGGWGLAWGTPLPITSAAVNPLDEFRPGSRQIVLGGDLGWAVGPARGRALYEREVDPGPEHLVAERLGGDLEVRLHPNVSFAGGADYDLAFAELGSAEAAVMVAIPGWHASVSAGGRRYRPYFELWSIWSVFSPVPYHAGFASVAVTPHPRVQVRARGELYWFDSPDAATPLAAVEDGGWRASLGATYRHSPSLIVTGDYHIDDGPGAGSLGLDASVYWRPIPRLGLRGSAANLQRVLELRFDDATVWLYSADADFAVVDQVRAFAGATYWDEDHDRPDVAAFSWSSLRLHAGLRLTFGSGADRSTLPPAVLLIPEGGAR